MPFASLVHSMRRFLFGFICLAFAYLGMLSRLPALSAGPCALGLKPLCVLGVHACACISYVCAVLYHV